MKVVEDLHPALNEWGTRIWLLLAKFFPKEDLFDASQPTGEFYFFDDRHARHPAAAFIAGSLLWGRRLVCEKDVVDPDRVTRWVRKMQSTAVFLYYDPRGASPSEREARTQLALMGFEIAKALRAGGVDEVSFLKARRAAQAAGRAARVDARSAHPIWLAVPVDADVRALSSPLHDQREGRLWQRIAQLHKGGATANAIAQRLGLDPQTVRRKLARRTG